MIDPALVDLASVAMQETLRSSIPALVEKHRKAKDRDAHRLTEAIKRFVDDTDQGALGLQVRDAYGWASTIHVQGMSVAMPTAGTSVSLDFAAVARRFGGAGGGDPQFDERDLIASAESFLVLGDPGSGKTTTLKRLTLSHFDEPQIQGGKEIFFPIVVLCRATDWSTTNLESAILGLLGFRLSDVHELLGTTQLSIAGLVTALLDSLPAMLIVDGVDEISDPAHRRKLLGSLEQLKRLTEKGRIVCSARSGEAPHLEGFSVAELLPLSSEQISEIANVRVSDASAFLSAVERSKVADLMNRPLFLNQLLTVYERTGGLPDRPVDLYRQILRLLLHEWDEQRRVVRRSAYADFDSSAKQDFLSQIAFGLTQRGKVVFSESDLIEIYEQIADSFGLPKNGAMRIVREIESHVGIVAIVPEGFQFTHLTLQEYLCADNIVRQGMNDRVADFLHRYPEIVALAVSLSSTPEEWLSECVRRSRSFEVSADADAFGSRLGLEQPRFKPSANLAHAVLRLLAQGSPGSSSVWRRLVEMQAVHESFARFGKEFSFERVGDRIRFARAVENDPEKRRPIPDGRIPIDLYELIEVDA